MRRLLVSLCVAAGILITLGGVVSAQSAPVFKLGFLALADQLPADVVGTPLENEYFNLSNGNSEQHTTKGLMVWRKVDNWTAYTNGYMTWINGPYGVQSRLNTDRFPWEKDPVVSAPAPAPAPPASTTAGVTAQPAGLQANIDSPREGSRLVLDLKITGWAVSPDEASSAWAGVDAFKVLLDGPEGTGKQLNVKVTRGQRPDVAAALGNPAYANSGFSIECNRAEVPLGSHSVYVYIHTTKLEWSVRQVGVTIVQPPFPQDSAVSIVDNFANTDGQTYATSEIAIVNRDTTWAMTDIRLYNYLVTGQPPRQASDEIALMLDRTFLRPGEQAKWGVYYFGADARAYVLVMSQVYSSKVYVTWRWVSPDGVQSDVRRQEKVLWSHN